jgi:putative nucleotidyltransferase with HDIG domain
MTFDMTFDNKYYRLMVDEIDTIKDIDNRKFALILLSNVPDYFFSVPASSSGKYHPKNDLGEGGLVRHSISVARMLDHLLEPYGYFDFNEEQKDLLKIAALFHDCMKSGTQEEYEKGKHTKFLHPLYAANFIMTEAITHSYFYEKALFIYNAVIAHMGQWNTNAIGELPTPKTPDQKVLHLADYLASRKDINMELDEVYFDEENDDKTPTEEVKE